MDEPAADVGAAARDGHCRPLVTRGSCDGSTDALGPPVDQHDLVVQQAHWASLPDGAPLEPLVVASRPMIDAPAGQFRAEACRLDELIGVVEVSTRPEDYPHATRIEQGVPVYDAGDVVQAAVGDVDEATAWRGELAMALLHGPGIVAVNGAVAGDVVDRASVAFSAMIAGQRAGAASGGDHFGAPGENDRLWNALGKLALADPATFVDYYASDAIGFVASAWLGPAYQVTSQINLVNPGGRAQSPHRDYHLGFLSDAVAAQYPVHVHRLSPVLTLQGAVAHCDMPVESGPTMYLPHSQKYEPGYVAWRRADSSTTSITITCSCRCGVAMPFSSTPPCSTPPAPIAPSMSPGWPICCRSPRRSAGQWSRSIGGR